MWQISWREMRSSDEGSDIISMIRDNNSEIPPLLKFSVWSVWQPSITRSSTTSKRLWNSSNILKLLGLTAKSELKISLLITGTFPLTKCNTDTVIMMTLGNAIFKSCPSQHVIMHQSSLFQVSVGPPGIHLEILSNFLSVGIYPTSSKKTIKGMVLNLI